MGELRNCVTCGKIFVQITRNICPDCIEKEEQEFMLVRDHIKHCVHPTVDDITEATGVDEKKILRWMREGRLEYSTQEGGIPGLTCKRCGIGIKIGEYCPVCVKSMVDQLKATPTEAKTPKAGQPLDNKRERMFVADRLRNS